MAPYLSTMDSSDTRLSPTNPASPKPKLYILSDFHPEAVKHAQSLFDCVLYGDPQGENWRSNATAILIKDYYIRDEDLKAASKLKVIGKQGVGLDKVDVEACERRGVKVCNSPSVNAGAVAEMTLCLALSVARQVPELVLRQRVDGEAIRKETVSGMLLSNKVVGIIGMGHIGQVVTQMFAGGFQCSIVAYDPYFPRTTGPWESVPHRRVDEEMCVDCNIWHTLGEPREDVPSGCKCTPRLLTRGVTRSIVEVSNPVLDISPGQRLRVRRLLVNLSTQHERDHDASDKDEVGVCARKGDEVPSTQGVK